MDDFLKREMQRLDGLLYGSLEEEEQELVDEAVDRGLARRVYEGVPGFLGLSTVRVA